MEISVCLIVKNEEKVLEKCLTCLTKFADEIIIVDTGSIDKTKEIAKKYTNKVYDFKWVDDFSAARNYSFSKATKDYIMWVDADDIITETEIEKINKLKINMSADVYMLKYAISFDENKNPIFTFYRERILRRNKNFLWQGFIHEVIVPSGQIEYLDITIEHHKDKPSDPKRNLKIYRKHIKNGEILSTRGLYYYSKELYFNGYYKKTIAELKKVKQRTNVFLPNLIDTYYTIGKCYLFLQEPDKALNTFFESMTIFPPSSEILCEIGNIFIEKKNFRLAIFFFETALTIPPDLDSGQFIDMNFYYLIPYLQLTMIYYQLGNYEKAKYYHLLTKKIYPDNPSVIYNQQFFNK